MLKKKMIANIKKTLNRESDESECDNSYLIEVPYIDEITIEVRKKIEQRYKKSRVNSVYKFPRSNSSNKLTPQKEVASSKNLSHIPSIRFSTSKSNVLNLRKNASSLFKPKISQTPMNGRSQNNKLLKLNASKYLPYGVQANSLKTPSNPNNSLQSLASSLTNISKKRKTAQRRIKFNLSIN